MTPSSTVVGAIFDSNKQYRYVLWRIWNRKKPPIMVIGLNPSTANEFENDNTITRLAGRNGLAKRWGHGGLIMMNLFPRVTPKPEELFKYQVHDENTGFIAKNDLTMRELLPQCSKVLYAWGSFNVKPRAMEVFKIVDESKIWTYILKRNADGSPMHPLYVPKNCDLKRLIHPLYD